MKKLYNITQLIKTSNGYIYWRTPKFPCFNNKKDALDYARFINNQARYNNSGYRVFVERY